MLSDMLRSISGLEIYPIISLVLFFSVFLFTVVKVWRLDKEYLRRMGNLPLEINDDTSDSGRIIR